VGSQCTLLVFIDFCPVYSEFLTWSFVDKTFDIGLTLLHFELLSQYLDMVD
jgi:hypothetical protein